MFGFTDYEMDRYRDLAQDFAVTEVAPKITHNANYVVPIQMINGKRVTDGLYLRQMVNDIEKIITFTTAHMAYDYANMQTELDWEESEIIKYLHSKYEDYLVIQFIKYGLGFTLDILLEVIGSIILELPYLYVAVIEDDSFDEDEFLEAKLDAYNDYLNEHMQHGETEPTEDEELDGN